VHSPTARVVVGSSQAVGGAEEPRCLDWPRLLSGLERGDAFLLDDNACGRLRRAAHAAGVHLRIQPASPPGGTGGQAGVWFRVTAYAGLTAADP
jgi:hypothetical protein